MRVSVSALVALALFVFTASSIAEIPQVMSYQGKVTDSGGTPVADGNYQMRFRILDTPTGANILWDSGTQTVAVNGGVFNVPLGESPQPAIDLDFGQDYWLLVTFEGVNQVPRLRLASAGYAHMASGLVAGTEVIGSITTGTEAALKVTNTAPTGFTYGVYGVSSSTQGRGVCGHATATSGLVYGVFGRCNSTLGHGVYGNASATSGDTDGVYGVSFSLTGNGVRGIAVATSGAPNGGYFESAAPSGTGVYGTATATTGLNYGVWGESASTSGTGVFGCASATMDTNYGIRGWTSSPSGYAGHFYGDVHVQGSFSKSSGSFLIDHPLDPENKLLRHNFVESPENLLIYRGKAQLDDRGEVVVEMPEYFQALTREVEATVTLTPVGKPFLTGYDIEPDNTSVRIYGESNREVSWVVYADRDDPVIRQLARPVEEEKGPDNKYCDKGKLLNPTAYGYPESMGRDYELHEIERQRMEEERARMEG